MILNLILDIKTKQNQTTIKDIRGQRQKVDYILLDNQVPLQTDLLLSVPQL